MLWPINLATSPAVGTVSFTLIKGYLKIFPTKLTIFWQQGYSQANYLNTTNRSRIVEKLTPKSFMMHLLNGSALGIVVALVPGALLGELFKALTPYCEPLGMLTQMIGATNAMVGIAVGVAIGYMFKFTPIESISVGLATMAANGVEHALCVSVNLEDWPDMMTLVGRHAGLLSASVGVHPDYLDVAEPTVAQLVQLAMHPQVVAIGETGLDYFRTGGEGVEAQQRSFREHIRLAKKHDLALQIHDRQAHDDVVRILLEEGAPERTVFHCYSGGAELARICNKQGWYMSFAGTVTFKNSKDIQESLRMARPELILAETDAPFLTPHPFRGRPNASYMTNYTVRFMAAHREQNLEDLCRIIRANSMRVYGSWGIEGF